MDVTLAGPLSIFGSENNAAGLSLNLLGGRSRSVYGLEVGTFYNGETESFAGVQVTLLGAASVQGNAHGLQASSIFNGVDGDCGFVVQGSFGVNFCGKSMRGLQVAGLANGADAATGIQIAGSFNIAGEAPFVIRSPSWATWRCGARDSRRRS